jgi:hypothetical protein
MIINRSVEFRKKKVSNTMQFTPLAVLATVLVRVASGFGHGGIAYRTTAAKTRPLTNASAARPAPRRRR